MPSVSMVSVISRRFAKVEDDSSSLVNRNKYAEAVEVITQGGQPGLGALVNGECLARPLRRSFESFRAIFRNRKGIDVPEGQVGQDGS